MSRRLQLKDHQGQPLSLTWWLGRGGTTWVVLRVGVDTFTDGFTLDLVISKPM